jgi:hypothetical protein
VRGSNQIDQQRRDYNIISVSTIDDHFATLALSAPARKKIIERNISLARTNKEIVDDWISKNGDLFRWATPNSGTTGLVALPKGIDDEQFCADLHRDHKVVSLAEGLPSLTIADPGASWKMFRIAGLCAAGILVRDIHATRGSETARRVCEDIPEALRSSLL